MRAIQFGLILLTTAAAEPAGVDAQAVVRPNIVLILLDNLGQEWLGCYGSEMGRTPNIDRLAREGVRVEHCYTPPVCGPSRVVLLTGRYPFRTGYTLHHDAGLYHGGGLDPVRDRTFASVLKTAGYRTGIFGKWQINNLYDEPDALTRHGFDEQVVWPASVDPAWLTPDRERTFRRAIEESDLEVTGEYISHIESRYWDPVVLRNGVREVLPGKFGPDVFQAAAVQFLREPDDRPFLLHYPMVLTHGQTFTSPVVPTPDNPIADRPVPEMFGDMVAYADKLIGEVAAELERSGLRERTILIVATDNGTEHRITARANGREVSGGLYSLSEAGSDVGLLFHAPGLIPGGRTIPLADFTGLLPTLCDLARTPLPDGRTFDGRSLAPFLRGDAGVRPPRDWIFNQYHTRRCIRDERYKLYSTGELYDVVADREEQHDLQQRPDPAAAKARERLAEVLASLPADAPPPFRLLSQSAFRLRRAGELRD